MFHYIQPPENSGVNLTQTMTICLRLLMVDIDVLSTGGQVSTNVVALFTAQPATLHCV